MKSVSVERCKAVKRTNFKIAAACLETDENLGIMLFWVFLHKDLDQNLKLKVMSS